MSNQKQKKQQKRPYQNRSAGMTARQRQQAADRQYERARRLEELRREQQEYRMAQNRPVLRYQPGVSKTQSKKQRMPVRRPPAVKKRPPLTEAQKKQRIFLMKFTLFLLLISLVTTLCLTVFFKITDITVEGNSRYTTEELVMTSGIEVGQNLFLTDGTRVRERLITQYPYISDVKVQKKLPARINLVVTETQAACKVPVTGGVLMVDTQGRILEKLSADDGTAVPQLMLCEGMENDVGGYIFPENQEMLELHQKLMNLLQQYGVQEKMTYISYYDHYDIRMMYDGRIEVKLGNQTNLEEKISQFVQQLPKLGDQDMGILTMTVENFKWIPFTPKKEWTQEERWWEHPLAREAILGGEENQEGLAGGQLGQDIGQTVVNPQSTAQTSTSGTQTNSSGTNTSTSGTQTSTSTSAKTSTASTSVAKTSTSTASTTG